MECNRRLPRRWGLRRRMATVLLLALALVVCGPLPDHARGQEDRVTITARPVPLDFADPERETVGRLRYRGGLALSSSDPRFGGISGLLVQPDGAAFISISDNGYWIRADLIHDEDENLVGIANATITPMLGLTGEALRAANERDAEALADGGAEGGLLVALERDHRLWHYQGPRGRPTPMSGPDALDAQPLNEGAEGLTTLNDGRLLAFSEGLRTQHGIAAWLRDDDGAWHQLQWRAGGGFQPTGATTLPDGDVLVLERRYPPIGVRLKRLAAHTIAPGALLEGEEIARLEGSLAVDNMEAIDVRRAADGETQVYLVADDNYSPTQTTYLMLFELTD